MLSDRPTEHAVQLREQSLRSSGGRKRVDLTPINPDGSSLGWPADFLTGSDGRVIACKYAEHFDDRWSIDELLDHVPAPEACTRASDAPDSDPVDEFESAMPDCIQ